MKIDSGRKGVRKGVSRTFPGHRPCVARARDSSVAGGRPSSAAAGGGELRRSAACLAGWKTAQAPEEGDVMMFFGLRLDRQIRGSSYRFLALTSAPTLSSDSSSEGQDPSAVPPPTRHPRVVGSVVRIIGGGRCFPGRRRRQPSLLSESVSMAARRARPRRRAATARRARAQAPRRPSRQ